MVKNPPAKAGDLGSIPGLEEPLEGGNGNTLKYSCLENPTDRRIWQAPVHGVTESGARLKWLGTHIALKHDECPGQTIPSIHSQSRGRFSIAWDVVLAAPLPALFHSICLIIVQIFIKYSWSVKLCQFHMHSIVTQLYTCVLNCFNRVWLFGTP